MALSITSALTGGALTGATFKRVGAIALAGALSAACNSNPIPLIAVQGTSFVLPVGSSGSAVEMPFGSELSTGSRPDKQRGDLVVGLCPVAQPDCPSPQYLVTRYVTSVMPGPASPAAILAPTTSAVYGMQPVFSPQMLVVVDIPDSVAPSEYSVNVRKRAYGSSPGQNETYLSDINPGTIRVVARPAGVPAAPNPAETRLGTGTFGIGQDLVNMVPYPTVVVRLKDSLQADSFFYPAAAEFEVTYPVNITIKGVYEEGHPGRGSIVLMNDNPATRTLRISLVDPKRCTPSVRVAYDWTAARTTPVVPADFSVVEANTRTYDLAGVPFTHPPGAVVVSNYAGYAGLLCAAQ